MSDVIKLGEARKRRALRKGDCRSYNEQVMDEVESGEYDFEAVMRRNREIEERARKEKAKANRSVLRSYRLRD